MGGFQVYSCWKIAVFFLGGGHFPTAGSRQGFLRVGKSDFATADFPIVGKKITIPAELSENGPIFQ